jgi:hypothetical protein
MEYLVLDYLKTLIWPVIVIAALWRYHDVIKALVPRSKVTFTIAGVSIETSLETLERSVEESFRGRKLSEAQWNWLERLNENGRTTYNHSHYLHLRPLRNSGLIREHPEGHLTDAQEIEITTLGRILFEAHLQSSKD